MPYVTILGKELEYAWYGPSTDRAPTLVFLHEGLGSVSMWRDFPQKLVESTDFGGLVYSRAGYGNSDESDSPRDVRFMHQEALAVLPELLRVMKIKEAILLGHSDGASISLIYAGSKGSVPILALVLEAPHVFVEEITVNSIAAAHQQFLHGNLRQRLQKHHANVEHTFLEWSLVWLQKEFRSWNIEAFLPGVPAPVLVIQGEKDQFGTLRQVKAIKRGCRGPVQILILPDCGHSPHREKPEQTLEGITYFLNANILK